jgi:hypothetical protein
MVLARLVIYSSLSILVGAVLPLLSIMQEYSYSDSNMSSAYYTMDAILGLLNL